MTQLSRKRLADTFRYNMALQSRIEYRDEYVAGEWLTPQGATAPDKVTVNIGGIDYLLMSFDGAATEERICNSFEINHDVDIVALNKGITKLEWHVHCMPSDNAAGNIKWFMDYTYLPSFGKPIVQPSLSITIPVEVNCLHKHSLGGVFVPKPPGGFDIGDIIMFNFRRTPADAGDTYGSDALFIKTALHVPIDTRGSLQRYKK